MKNLVSNLIGTYCVGNIWYKLNICIFLNYYLYYACVVERKCRVFFNTLFNLVFISKIKLKIKVILL